jgi:hemerythrin-like domain-containing protein
MIDTSETRTVMRPGRSEASETPGADWAPIQAEHRALATSVERLDRTLAGVAAGTLASWTEVQMLLRNFRRLLWLHLDSEERSGILERAADAEPRFERRISRLRSEHDELRREVDALATGPDAASAGADWRRPSSTESSAHRTSLRGCEGRMRLWTRGCWRRRSG